MSNGKMGSSTGSVEYSKDRKKAMHKAKMRQSARWNRKNGQVQVRFVCPECGGPHSKADHGKVDETPAPRLDKSGRKVKSKPKRAKRDRKSSGKTAWEHAALNAAFESRIDDPES